MTKERAIKVIDCILNDTLCDGCIGEDTTSCVECRREVADMAIEALQEQKTGYWIDVTKSDRCFLWKCSECGNDYIENTDYCPNCGARMEREEDG